MAISISVATDMANMALKLYTKGPTLAQTMQQKPLVGFLKGGQKTFASGKNYISDPVQGAYMSDTAGFFKGYTASDQLTFAQAQNTQRCEVEWKEVHAGLVITFTELKIDGVSVTDGAKTSKHAGAEVTRLIDVLENRMDDFGESWARCFNTMLWSDGTQDSKQIIGVRGLLQDTNDAQTVAGLAQNTYTWWRQRLALGASAITPSPADQTLSNFLRNELIQLKRFGGKPNKALCGSLFWDALMREFTAKGVYTQSGFTGNNDLGMSTISQQGLGSFEYDPTLDDMGLSKRCYVFDSRRVKLRPMEGEDNKVLTPERPYDQMVFLRSMTWTGALQITQLNCHGIYEIS